MKKRRNRHNKTKLFTILIGFALMIISFLSYGYFNDVFIKEVCINVFGTGIIFVVVGLIWSLSNIKING